MGLININDNVAALPPPPLPVVRLGHSGSPSPRPEPESHATQLLQAAAGGDSKAAAELLPLVYEELRRLAAAKMAQQTPGQTLQATALVHEAYLRLTGGGRDQWQNRAQEKPLEAGRPAGAGGA